MGESGDFIASMDFREALGMYIFLRSREEDLAGAAERLYCRLRAYLYERLSIEEMECPEELLSRLEKRR
jgi:hypothetical protein